MGKGRPPSFQFYPRDFIASTSVSLMSPEERGGYIMLLCHAWESAEHGVLPNDDKALSRLSGLGERWPECREAIARAFTVTPDHWIQGRMVAEREEQAERFQDAVKGGKVRAERLSPERRSEIASLGGQAKSKQTASTEQAGSACPVLTPASASASALKDITPCPPDGGRPRVRAVKSDPLWERHFDAFWQAYPRKQAKADALKAWNALQPHEDAFAARIMAGLARYVADGHEPQYTKLPAGWLRSGRFDDETAPKPVPHTLLRNGLPENETYTCHRCLKPRTRPRGSMVSVCQECRP